MRAHIIINPARPVPNNTILDEIECQGIKAKFWDPIPDKNNVVRSINLSHKQIVQFAIDHHLPQVCIMEEDVMFTAAGAWQYFQANMPDEFDLYLAGTYGLNLTAWRKIAEGTGPVEIHNFAGLHCYIINNTYYDRFLALPEDRHIDDQPGLGRFYVCAPFAALQHPGYSCNARTKVNYNINVPPECIYYGPKKPQ